MNNNNIAGKIRNNIYRHTFYKPYALEGSCGQF
jgi:hypothetical protein